MRLKLCKLPYSHSVGNPPGLNKLRLFISEPELAGGLKNFEWSLAEHCSVNKVYLAWYLANAMGNLMAVRTGTAVPVELSLQGSTSLSISVVANWQGGSIKKFRH